MRILMIKKYSRRKSRQKNLTIMNQKTDISRWLIILLVIHTTHIGRSEILHNKNYHQIALSTQQQIKIKLLYSFLLVVGTILNDFDNQEVSNLLPESNNNRDIHLKNSLGQCFRLVNNRYYNLQVKVLIINTSIHYRLSMLIGNVRFRLFINFALT